MIEIRPAGPQDAEGVLAIYRPIVVETHVSFELEAPTVAEMARRMAAADGRHPWLVAADEEGLAGYAYATSFRARPAYEQTVETSVYVDAGRHRTGVARALYLDLFERLRSAGVRSVIAGIALPNDASVALHERLGFTPVGVFHDVGRKFDRWWSVGFWERPIGE